MNRKHLAFASVLFAGAVASAGAQNNPADVQKAAEEKAVNLCSTCHGPRGISTSPEFPILAAQRNSYLEAQIDAFRKRTRAEKDAHDFMWGIAGNLDEEMIGRLAGDYASQPPAPGRSDDPALIAKGKELSRQRGSRERHSGMHGMSRRGCGGRSGLSAAGRSARQVRGQAAELYPVARSRRARDARYRQGSCTCRNSGGGGLRAIQVAEHIHYPRAASAIAGDASRSPVSNPNCSAARRR